MDYLLRDDSPFGGEIWSNIDEMVVKVAKDQLIGRRFINIFGPLGAGVDSMNIDTLDVDMESRIDFNGEAEDTPIKVNNRKYVTIPMIYKDFALAWRDVEKSKQMGLPLDLSSVAVAATSICNKEDDVIFNGNALYGYDGLTTAAGREVVKKGDWSEGETPLTDVAAGIEVLVRKGFYGPYVLVVSPDLYLKMHRIQPGTGVMEIERVSKLVGGKIYQTPVLGSNKAILLSKGSQNMDLVLGQDLVTAYLGPEQLNHSLRILETLLLRIKRPEAIVTFE
ncbi:MAG: family 1 encapsulin nanocompartment shell protein [Thermotaleaceae bacterium]